MSDANVVQNSMKLVLFGAGRNGKRVLAKLKSKGVQPDFVVDNMPSTCSAEWGKVFKSDVLLLENKKNLKIIITPLGNNYNEISKQLESMGLGDCIIPLSVYDKMIINIEEMSVNKVKKQMMNHLQNSEIVLFGAGENCIAVLSRLLDDAIMPKYLVDNNKEEDYHYSYKSETYKIPILPPHVLESEDKQSLKVIITPDEPHYSEIEQQLIELGYEANIFSTKIIGCTGLLNELWFSGDMLAFCCTATNGLNDGFPELSYYSSTEETISNFLDKRELIIYELSGHAAPDLSKPCTKCKRLYRVKGSILSGVDFGKLARITIGNYPSVCQAKCIYCSVHKDSKNSYKNAKTSQLPMMIAEIVHYFKERDLIANNCLFTYAPAEITVMPYKDELLDVGKGYKSQFFTNAFIFDPRIADLLKIKGSYLNVSLDSGTKESFKMVKGVDVFEKTINNLIKYREYGVVCLKYIIMPGVNDSDEDINGIVNILKLLNMEEVTFTRELSLPFRAMLHSFIKFVDKLEENGLKFGFHLGYNAAEMKEMIKSFRSVFLHGDDKIRALRKAYVEECEHDFRIYRQYVYKFELMELLSGIKKGVTYAILDADYYTRLAIDKLGMTYLEPGLPYMESYKQCKDIADVFLIRKKQHFDELHTVIAKSEKGNVSLICTDNYYDSTESVYQFLKGYIQDGLISGGNI